MPALATTAFIYNIYIYIYIYIYNYGTYIYISIYQISHKQDQRNIYVIMNIRVATDEGPGPKLALSEGGSR